MHPLVKISTTCAIYMIVYLIIIGVALYTITITNELIIILLALVVISIVFLKLFNNQSKKLEEYLKEHDPYN